MSQVINQIFSNLQHFSYKFACNPALQRSIRHCGSSGLSVGRLAAACGEAAAVGRLGGWAVDADDAADVDADFLTFQLSNFLTFTG